MTNTIECDTCMMIDGKHGHNCPFYLSEKENKQRIKRENAKQERSDMRALNNRSNIRGWAGKDLS